MTVVVPICESVMFVFNQMFDLIVIFIKPVLVTFGFETDCFFAGIRQNSIDMGPMFSFGKIIVGRRQ